MENTLPKKATKPLAVAKSGAKTNDSKGSLVKCEVKLEQGEWVSPDSCGMFYIDEDAKFPDITYEIKTNAESPYTWEWVITWQAEACKQAEGKERFKAKKNATFSKTGAFKSDEKKWKADLGEVIGGDLTVKVKAGSETFVRKTLIRGKNPGKERIVAEIDSYDDKKNNELAKKIVNQESKYRHFYTDEIPLTSFDNGYGLAQFTNPEPSYTQIWNWKEHIKELLKKRIPTARSVAKDYLSKHPGYSQEEDDLETMAAYNGLPKGQRYHTWNATEKKWQKNDNVICDPEQSNKGWLLSDEENKNKTLDDLKKGDGGKPFYTGRCYAEHIKNSGN